MMEKLRFPHFRAILFRRITLFKRSVKPMVISGVMSLIFSLLAIVANYLMKTLMKDKVVPITFNTFWHHSGDLVFHRPEDGSEYYKEFLDLWSELYQNDTGQTAERHEFASRDELNDWMYANAVNKTGPESIVMGIGFNNQSFLGYNLTAFYNGSWVRNEQMAARVTLTRLVWKHEFGKDTDFVFSVTRLMKRMMDFVFGELAPMLIVCGLISIIPLIIPQPIIDIRGEVRRYMMSCSLSLVPYWLATFIVDFCIWMVLVNLVWLVFVACMITAIHDNLFNSWYTFMAMGPPFILFVYCLSFLFSSAESGTRQLFIILVLLLLVPLVVDVVRQEPDPEWLEWIYALVPHIATQRILQEMLVRVNILKQPFSYYWKDDQNSRPFLVMQYGDIIIYAVVLCIIEKVRVWVANRATRFRFGGYRLFFDQVREKHPVTQEAKDMEEHVHQREDFAVRILDCSRLFFNTAGEPIAAVNNVSLGVEKNSVFGFLGANGAGKTTLIKMIMSLLPPSSGKIFIDGVDISDDRNTSLAVCPQFNSHLCDEMTPKEHFKLYSLIHQLEPNEAAQMADDLIEQLQLTPHVDKPVRELSGGNQRKLAIALSFFGPATILLLDEPTSSLDPVARHNVHELINKYRGKKTFMLCTHLLSEAESLCDNISIMIKGCVYTCGSPQYLSQKFGTEFKIEVILDKEDPKANAKCSAFFQNLLPDAKLTILRPSVRIYSIPSNVMKLSQLFAIMAENSSGDNGFVYYTCSSSSLERVFMEIVHLSENDDAVYAGNDMGAM